jgi:deoxyribodipyrimidine photolyase-related protein
MPLEKYQKQMGVRNLVLVLGDQLDPQSAAFEGFDDRADAILMVEVGEEASYIKQHKMRLAFFFSAMRHFRDEQQAAGRRVFYSLLDDSENLGSFAMEIPRRIAALKPDHVKVLEPGDWRVRAQLEQLTPAIELCEDRHFLCSRSEFDAFSDEHPRPMLEKFYRMMRRRHGMLMDAQGKPVGGAWNFDAENRVAFGRNGPPLHRPMAGFSPDPVTREVMAMVEREFAGNPGKLDAFDLPVTRKQGQAALADFVDHRLPLFGRYQDAMQTGQAFLFHSHLAGLLNLHQLDPREVIAQVLDNPSNAPLNGIEGFIRQVIGWREFVRGIYWRRMPGYADLNALDADQAVPGFYWTGETEMRCLAEAIGHTIEHAYAHHIERLMVLGLFCLLLGVRPYAVHQWHMSMFWDAIDWVSLPNTLGMSQYGDGGITGTKPYAASGNYINRMSDHCRHCRYDPGKATGETACPFTTLYWDFLARHAQRFSKNPRMSQQYANLRRKDDAEMKAIRAAADRLKARLR